MPTYNPRAIEPRWQAYWLEQKTFRTGPPDDRPKFYLLDMFPYPSGHGLHVGHPEGYTATDILARYKRMRGFQVMHPMGWDAFGLPAEQFAVRENVHPSVTTQKNIDEFRRQIRMLGFSYDWDREVDTTDPSYYRWTQWIFLQLHDTWYDHDARRGRPIAELPVPDDVRAGGDGVVRRYQDSRRLAYQSDGLVNWCEDLGTVLANEEVIDGKSERGDHPVTRVPLRQWYLRITDYAERLIDDLALVDWSDSIKKMQRDWIGRSEGAEVDFAITPAAGPTVVVRVFTTRPDTLFGATYLVLSPEHPLLDGIVAEASRDEVRAYQQAAARKSDLERSDLAKAKTGVFTGAFAANPVNGEKIPVWIADYVLASYGTGAIMAVPAHDKRDFEFARAFKLPVRPVVQPSADWLRTTAVCRTLSQMVRNLEAPEEPSLSPALAPAPSPPTEPIGSRKTLTMREARICSIGSRLWEQMGRDLDKVLGRMYRQNCDLFDTAYEGEGSAINSPGFDGMPSSDVRGRVVSVLRERGLGQPRVNYRLRDWLFSRQRYWGEPFPLLHEVDADGKPTGLTRPVPEAELPVRLPDLSDFKPTGKPEPLLEKATDWVWVERDGTRYRRETNTMPQWAGSCWYYLRYLDPCNRERFCDPLLEARWMPVDLYVGGAEHAVLHLLYSRFWHKVLFDRGHVHSPEPFQRLVNQGMILGEHEFTAFQVDGSWVSAKEVEFDGETAVTKKGGHPCQLVRVPKDKVEKAGESYLLADSPIEVRVDARAFKMSKSRGNVINPNDIVAEFGADSLRLYEMFMGPLEATKPWSTESVPGVFRFLSRVWRLVVDDRAEAAVLSAGVRDVEPDAETLRLMHRTIKKVTEDIEGLSFNTAIAAMMEFSNHLTGLPVKPKSVLALFVLILSPFAPHVGEELWRVLGHGETLAYHPWPAFDEALTRAAAVEIPVQINGKVRAKLLVPAGTDKGALEAAALADDKVRAQLEGKQVKKVITVPDKMVNIVVG